MYDVYKEIFLNWMTWKLPNYRYVNCVSIEIVGIIWLFKPVLSHASYAFDTASFGKIDEICLDSGDLTGVCCRVSTRKSKHASNSNFEST